MERGGGNCRATCFASQLFTQCCRGCKFYRAEAYWASSPAPIIPEIASLYLVSAEEHTVHCHARTSLWTVTFLVTLEGLINNQSLLYLKGRWLDWMSASSKI